MLPAFSRSLLIQLIVLEHSQYFFGQNSSFSPVLLIGHQNLAPREKPALPSYDQNCYLHASRSTLSSRQCGAELYSVVHKLTLGLRGFAAWKDTDEQGGVGQSRPGGLWEHEGRCQTHSAVGVGQVGNGKNIFATETESWNVLQVVQTWWRGEPTGLRVIPTGIRIGSLAS